jgi:hypothetical protein
MTRIEFIPLITRDGRRIIFAVRPVSPVERLKRLARRLIPRRSG